MAKQTRDGARTVYCFGSFWTFKIQLNGEDKVPEPTVKVVCADGQIHVFLKGIALVGIVAQQQRRPKCIHGGQMRRPVHVLKNRREYGIFPDLLVKQVYELPYISRMLNVG